MYCIIYYIERIYKITVFILLVASFSMLLSCLMNAGLPARDDRLIKYAAITSSIVFVMTSICCYCICKSEINTTNDDPLILENQVPFHSPTYNEEIIREVKNEKQMPPVLAVAEYIHNESRRTSEESIEDYPIDELPIASALQNV